MKDRKQELDTLWKDKEKFVENQVIEMPTKSNLPAMQSQAASFLSIIDKMASIPDADIAKMQAVMDLYNQQIARERQYHKEDLAEMAKQEFFRDFALMSPELPIIIKTKENKHTHSTYADLADINQGITPILGKYGFSISHDIIKQTKEDITIVTTLMHKGGHTKDLELTLPLDGAGFKGSANKTDIQAISSSISYAKRIGECAILNISAGDDKDGNRPTNNTLATDAQRAAINSLFQKLTPQHQEMFIQEFGGIAEITKKNVDAALARLNNTIKTYNKQGTK